ncbi:MAG: hypothetical protein ACTHYM_13445 [Actinomycetaceae bacterium]
MLPPGGESESEAGSAGAGAESETGAAGEERVDFTVPEGWEDASEIADIPAQTGVGEMHTLLPSGDVSGTTTMGITTFDPSVTGGAQSYVEMIEATGGDTSAFTELEPRDIGGYEADGIDGEQDLGTGVLRQQAYGVVLEDGSLVQVLVIAPSEEFDQHQAAFDELVDSIEIN